MEVEEILDDSGDASGYLVKGYATSKELEVAIRKEHVSDFEIGWAVQVKHAIMRKVPVRNNQMYDFYYWPSEPGRGAFRCTVAWM